LAQLNPSANRAKNEADGEECRLTTKIFGHNLSLVKAMEYKDLKLLSDKKYDQSLGLDLTFSPRKP
jgi:hypothetical protein